MVMPVLLIPQKATYPTLGGVALDARVLKVEFPEVLDCAAAFAEVTSKSYRVPEASPVNVAECVVTSVASSVENDPYPLVTP
jgi:hypothetical protein